VVEQKRSELEEQLTTLQDEKQRLLDSIAETMITDEHMQSITEFAAQIRDKLSNADFALKRQLMEALNVHVVLAVEDGEKVVYVQWYTHSERLCKWSHAT
jgi:aspartokinase